MLREKEGTVATGTAVPRGSVAYRMEPSKTEWCFFFIHRGVMRRLSLAGPGFGYDNPSDGPFFVLREYLFEFEESSIRDFTKEDASPGDYLILDNGRHGLCANPPEDPLGFVPFDGDGEFYPEYEVVSAFKKWRVGILRDGIFLPLLNH